MYTGPQVPRQQRYLTSTLAKIERQLPADGADPFFEQVRVPAQMWGQSCC
jgi:hypothetical protein